MDMHPMSSQTEQVKEMSSYTVRIARSFDEVEAIRPAWQALQSRQPEVAIEADIDHYIASLVTLKSTIEPYVIALFDKDEPVAMAIGCIEEHRVHTKFGYKTVLDLPFRCMSVVYGGILDNGSDAVRLRLMHELRSVLRQKLTDIVFLNHLNVQSSFYEIARKTPGALMRGYYCKVEPHWRMTIPENMTVFYQTHKRIRTLQQQISRLDRAYTNQVKVVNYRREDEVDTSFNIMASIAAKTYQQAMGCGFVSDERARAMMTTAARQGWLNAYVLFVADEPCAFDLVFQYGKIAFLRAMGYDPKWSKYGVGSILFVKIIEEFCGNPAVEEMDFGFGDAEYKQRYCTNNWPEASVYVFAPRLYPVCANMLQSGLTALSSGLTSMARTIGVERLIKRRWREVLRQKNTEN